MRLRNITKKHLEINNKIKKEPSLSIIQVNFNHAYKELQL